MPDQIHYKTIYSILKKTLLKNHPNKTYYDIHSETNLLTSFLNFTQAGIISLNNPLKKAFLEQGYILNISGQELKNCKKVRHIFNVINKKFNPAI